MAFSSEQIQWLQKLGASTGPAVHSTGSAQEDPGTALDLPSNEEPDEPERHVEHDTQSYDTNPIRKHARNDFPDEVDIFTNLWLTAAVDALAGAPEAEEPESQTGWWIALAGNMIWAATCLVPPAKGLQIAIMSFGGAAAGSGIYTPGSSKAPSGKKMISGMLTQARDAMVKAAGSVMDLAATQCADKQIVAREEQRKVLWSNLFNTPFNESEPIRQQMSVKIEAGLKSYNEQWRTWREEIASLARQNASNRKQSPGEARFGAFVNDDDRKMAVARHPFKPELSFD
jgi:hypothetical protein